MNTTTHSPPTSVPARADGRATVASPSMTATPQHRPHPFALPYCYIVALLLLGAAALAHLRPDPAIPAWYRSLALAFELPVAAVVLALRHHPAGLRIATVAFALLSLVAAWHWLMGHESCGCFGAFKVPPAVTTALDLTVFLVGLAISLSSPLHHSHTLSPHPKPEPA